MAVTFGFLGSSDDSGQWKSNKANTIYNGAGEQLAAALGLRDSAGVWLSGTIYYTGSAKQLVGDLGWKDTNGTWMDSNGQYWTLSYTFSGTSMAPSAYTGQIYPNGSLQ